MKILAVDDNEFLLTLLPMIIAKAGFEDVSTACSGFAALEVLRSSETPFDCLVLDINMPGMDGIDLCARVRALPNYRKTPIIMLTAMSERQYIDSAFKAGATDFATKPFDIVELGTRLRLAQELILAREEMVTSIEGIVTPSAPQASSKFNLPERIQLEGVQNLVSFPALSNYLTQLSRVGLVSTQVIAIKIDRIEAIHSRATSDEFTNVIKKVADVISEAFNTTGHIMLYAGSGTFVVASNKAHLESSITLETEVQISLDDSNLKYDSGESVDIVISIGNPIIPNFSKTQGARKTIERAIARAENRVLKKRSHFSG